METLTCIALARELARVLDGLYVQSAEQADSGLTLLLRVRGASSAAEQSGWVMLSACGGQSAIFFCRQKPKLPGRTWPAPLSAHIERLVVRSVSHGGMDRTLAVALRSSPKEDSGPVLLVELFAAKPRAYLVRPETSEVISSFGGSRESVSGDAKSGVVYTPSAPPSGKLDPLKLSAEAFDADLPSTVSEEDLVNRLFGVGKVLAKEVVARIGATGVKPAAALKELISRAAEGEPEGYLVRPAQAGAPPIALTFEPSYAGSMEIKRCTTVNEAVRRSFFSCRRMARELERRRKASKDLRADLGRVVRTRNALLEELDYAGRTGRYRRNGELILTHMGRIKKGASEIELPDPEKDGVRLRIGLEARLSPAQNADLYFKRARKLQKKLLFLPGRIEELTRREKALEAELEQIMSGRPAAETKTPPPAKEHQGEKSDRWPTGVSPRRFVSFDGWTMYVGRNNKENDYITFTFAKPNDFWFHAHGVPGSHVVLRREGRKAKPSKRCIEEAASVAAYFSKGRTSQTVGVSYTEKRYVRKPRKGKPGTALISHEKTVMVSPQLPPETE